MSPTPVARRSPPVDGGASEVDTCGELYELVAIADCVIALQPEIQCVLVACRAEGAKDAALARRGQRLASGLLDLSERVNRLTDYPIASEVRSLLRYHREMLEQALLFAYSGSPGHCRQIVSFYSDDLGEPALRLRRLRSLIAG